VGLLIDGGWRRSIASSDKITPLYSRWTAILNLILIAIIWINGALLSFYPFTQKNGKSLTVTMIQGNVPQELKWQPDQLGNIVDKYHLVTRNHWKSDLIIWPEGAIPALSTVAEPFLDSLGIEAKSHHSSVMLGIPVAEGEDFYNGLVMVGQSTGTYYKRHLVPFGEYVPLKFLLNPLISSLNIPMSDFSRGPAKQPLLIVNDIPMSAFICYEIVEPDEVRRALNHAELIVTITDDSWFDGSIASEQHLQMARMRSIENGLPQLFLSSRGASAIITSRGFIKYYLPEHKEGVITAEVFTVEGKTPWRTLGSWPVLLLSIIGVIFTRFGRIKNMAF
jgi:apolipoprotein N-acyltransferase